MSSDSLRLRERKADRKAKGLCVDCGKGPAKGSRCEACTARHRERQAAYQDRRPVRPRDPRTPFAWCGECLFARFGKRLHRRDCPLAQEAP